MVDKKASPTLPDERITQPESSGPDVIVDFIFDEGLFFIAVNNIGDKPAFKVSVKFDHKLRGLNGTKEISALPLFRNIEFLAPQKQIVTFLDQSNSYFNRKEPTKISARISYRDSQGREHLVTIDHDLEIYREIGFIKKAGDRFTTPDETSDLRRRDYGSS